MAFVRRFSPVCKLNALFNEIRVNRSAPTLKATLKTTTVGCAESGWLQKLLVRKIEPGTEPHSRLLSDSDFVYELQIHDVKPGLVDEYLKNYENYVGELKNKDKTYELVGSWKVDIGDEDQMVHIWRFDSGFSDASKILKLLKTDDSLSKLVKQQTQYLRQRQNQLMMSFSFWGHPEPCVRNSMYELRSYVLKPGTMIEWGNNWSRGIHVRQNKVAGFFSQVGQLYMAHHLWHYTDLQNRKDVREDAWSKPGWDEIVAYTVPLIREMRSRWMVPNSFSPIR
ncbi:protein NipSnap-like protein [Leptotrombidium deliense]|uniref:Protein NipSnap-like protein n=1 Tax=Leptotrombidium deliense TaxID=299467 RepID=A0A443SGK2_9ACAR|nr:protein NipSnap-like protein [Leptotrombidium deliense]